MNTANDIERLYNAIEINKKHFSFFKLMYSPMEYKKSIKGVHSHLMSFLKLWMVSLIAI
ncbi:hypothetical protein [Veillonella sp. VA142]|uniref:hypothetical protein n=1 Tax=Veillonella sp. VA142 TaxID=741834 RepID=UPI0013DEB22F|nr:hypothetical protein [Veillonella sp. VA142]